MTTLHNTDSSTSNKTALDILRQDYKSMLLVALIFTASYIGSIELAPDHADGFAGLFAFILLVIVFAVSVIATLIYSGVVVVRYRSQSWAVLLAAPILYIGLPLLIGYNTGIYRMHLREARYQERMSVYERPTPKPIPTATTTPRPYLAFEAQGIAVEAMNLPAMYQQPLTGLSIKSQNVFTNTFKGNRVTLLHLYNVKTKQKVTIEAIYSEFCAAHWRKDDGGSDAHQLSRITGNVVNSEMPVPEAYRCVGLQLAEPIKVGDAYIGIEPDQTGGPVGFAELPQLINVITNAQPAQPSS